MVSCPEISLWISFPSCSSAILESNQRRKHSSPEWWGVNKKKKKKQREKELIVGLEEGSLPIR
jgi:hypothetical protein